MEWTQELPSVEGAYWMAYLFNDNWKIEVVRFRSGDVGRWVDDWPLHMGAYMGGDYWWMGPLEIPEPPTVTP